ncbi:unnamed protein product [Strongylus vulgaris]|uniref:acid phosphatase n=1 Tax=Strongylus vulgaris TaxID=40348 RepID=A0A3P7KFC6_STRVU|nr:unnamed protein product [Strongylus vulgaris]
MMIDSLSGEIIQMWRHGDRSPTKTFKNDPIQEANWTFGGGGFGQLSPLGMHQMLRLGKLIRETYIDTKFLSNRYSSKEVCALLKNIYIRSTDTNRTIISALSNIMGMYGTNADHVPGRDYPDDTSWPSGYVPIPVHTIFKPTDYVCFNIILF